jgi:hypothetical protein
MVIFLRTVMSLISTDEYCTFNYWYDRYGDRHASEYCVTTDTYSNFFGYDYDKSYNSYEFLDSYSDIYSTDKYCSWDYGYFTDTETCTTTTTYLNGDWDSYTDVYYFPA